MKEGDQYERVTENQIELWEKSAVTQAYLQCLAWLWEVAGTLDPESVVVADNADTSHALLSSAIGAREAFAKAQKVREVLQQFGLVEEANERAA